MTKHIMTPKQAWEYVHDRQTQYLIGLDYMDYLRFLIEGQSNEVVMLIYFLEEGMSLSESLKQNILEIDEQASGAMNILLQLYCGRKYQLMIDDVNDLSWFVNAVNQRNINFAWGLESADTTEFNLKICIFIIK